MKEEEEENNDTGEEERDEEDDENDKNEAEFAADAAFTTGLAHCNRSAFAALQAKREPDTDLADHASVMQWIVHQLLRVAGAQRIYGGFVHRARRARQRR